MSLSLGLDCGTSACKAVVIDAQGQSVYSQRLTLSDPSDPTLWQATLEQILARIPRSVAHRIHHIGVAGTSGTVLLTDGAGQPIAPVLMYDDPRGEPLRTQLEPYVPASHGVLNATSSLLKLFWYHQQGIPLRNAYFLHQADWLGFLLHGQLGISDEHNSLKLGYDPGLGTYPDWFAGLPLAVHLPRVFRPGVRVGTLQPSIAAAFHLPTDCHIHAGTTDSMAALIASGAHELGEGVTSLGSTLVLKLLSPHRIDDPKTGVYSHRLGNLWLVGGASNTGGAVLRHFFSEAELVDMSAQIDPTIPVDFDYYPLLKPGERFPTYDPHLPPRLSPQPDNPVLFLQGLLTAMARIEAQGYRVLRDLGAPPLQRVFTSGGGSCNRIWQEIRQQILGVPVGVAQQQEAAWGVARLAQQNGL